MGRFGRPVTGSTIDKVRALQAPHKGQVSTGSKIDLVPKGRTGKKG